MAKKRITSQDVADLAEVSRTTVSLVLNNVEGVSIPAATREKIFKAVRKLGYVPNASARALASQRAQAIGLIMTRSPDQIASDAFFPMIIAGLLNEIKEEQFRLMIEIVQEHHEDAYIELAQAKHIDGMIILTPSTPDKGLRKLHKMGIPTVLFGQLPEYDFPYIQIDNRSAAKKATEYLVGLGHSKIAFISNANLSYSGSQDRLSGYQDALLEAGIQIDPDLIEYGDFSPGSGFAAMQKILEKNIPFTAVFVASDNVALGAKSALSQAGLMIPEDVSMVGFDDLPWAAYASPPLTTIRLPAREMAVKASQLLLDIIKGKEIEEKNIILDTELIVRQSCR